MSERIEALEARIAALEARLAALERAQKRPWQQNSIRYYQPLIVREDLGIPIHRYSGHS